MKFNLIILSISLFLVLTILSSVSSSCKKRTEFCRGASDCCSAMGVRMVCAPSLAVCGKRVCCITEVEEQQEKQAAMIRNRNPKSKRFWNLHYHRNDDDWND